MGVAPPIQGGKPGSRPQADQRRYFGSQYRYHIDIDAAELDKIKTAHIGIVADVGEALANLLPQLAENTRQPWVDRCNALKAAHPQPLPDRDDPRSHFGLIRAIADCLDDEASIATVLTVVRCISRP